MSAKHNGHASREQLALEVQTEALRPTPPLNGESLKARRALQERLNIAWMRIRQLEDCIAALQRQKRVNKAQFQREIAKQREELGIREP